MRGRRPCPICRCASSAPTWTRTALQLARHHAEKAGVAEQIHFQRRPSPTCTASAPMAASSAIRPTASGWAAQAEIQDLYRDMPEVFRRLKTWSFYVLTAQPDFEALLGQEADRRRKLYNGRIECTYYQYYGPKPGRRSRGGFRAARREAAPPVAAGLVRRSPAGENLARPAFGGLSHKAREQAEIFRSRLAQTRPAPPPLADEVGHYLLPALRSRHSRGAAGGRSL